MQRQSKQLLSKSQNLSAFTHLDVYTLLNVFRCLCRLQRVC